ncbi:MAG: thioredoxin domain-containing protein [Candidatus Caenarcaniphilales bacterium]|nr:thioredoxin domain-containing protein [Candidatus Caenarcaniphilales bacterium]
MACLCFITFASNTEAQSKKYYNLSSNQSESQSSEKDIQYAKCLQEKGITMYGTSWCPHCKRQKETFGELFNYVNYVDCQADREVCVKNGVHGYPTWLLPNGKEIPQGTVASVAKAAGCTLEQPITKAGAKQEVTSSLDTDSVEADKVDSVEESVLTPAVNNPKEKREFYAKCLGEKEVTMYGLSHCPHCKAQKKEFGELFQYVKYIECDRPIERCLEASKKGKGYPTWLTKDGAKIEPGSVEEVALDAGCKLPSSNNSAPVPASNKETSN